MKGKVVCIFAHPDDEAFGPSGTIAKFADENDVYLVCVTDGNDKTNGLKNLTKIRENELRKSSKILGVKKVFNLNYEDGELSNNKYHKLVEDIGKILRKIRPNALLTFEMRGVSGHIDHVFCSMVSSFLFKKFNFIKKIYYFAERQEVSEKMKDYFIYYPKGFKREEVDEIFDISKYWNKKIAAIKVYKSQKKDTEKILKLLKNLPPEEFFFVSEKC